MDPSQPTSRSDTLPPAAETANLGESAATGFRFRLGYFRWVICALLLLGTTKNYMDRQVVFSILPVLTRELGFSSTQLHEDQRR